MPRKRARRKAELTDIDREIIKLLQEDCKISLDEMAERLNIPKSTLHYRIRRLENLGVIEKCYAKIDPIKVGKNYFTITLVRARYGPGYHERVGEKLAKIPGVWAVYYVLGDIDFVVLARTSGPDEYMKILEEFINDEDIERTTTLAVAKVIKEDPRVEVD